MKLKRRNKAIEIFSMASMTDVIFLLLIFFMVTSTLVVPSALKVILPQSNNQAEARPMTRVVIDADLRYYVGNDRQADRQVSFEEIAPFLEASAAAQPDMYVALYADETVPYNEVVRVLSIAVEHRYRMVLATRPISR